jgi:putative ABC transport system permease protein
LIAARYQIMVMCMIFSSAGISTALFLWLIRIRGQQACDQMIRDKCGS